MRRYVVMECSVFEDRRDVSSWAFADERTFETFNDAKEWIRINCEDIGGTWIDISFYSNYCKDADRWGNWKIISMNVNPTCDTATEEIFGY